MKRWLLLIAVVATAVSLLVAARSKDHSDSPVPSSRDIFPKVLDHDGGTRDGGRGAR